MGYKITLHSLLHITTLSFPPLEHHPTQKTKFWSVIAFENLVCGSICDCSQNNHVCTRIWVIFPHMESPIHRKKKPNFHKAKTHNYGWLKKLIGPWKFKQIAWNRKRRAWESTWIKRGEIPSDNAHGIFFWSSKLKYTMLGKNFIWYENF